MTTPTEIREVGWAGWWRANSKCRWSRVAAADDYAGAWNATLDALVNVHGGESLVTRIGVNPNSAVHRPYRRRGRPTVHGGPT